MPVLATCHCGACEIRLAEAPAEVTGCNCSICRRYGVLWAYYPLAAADLSGLGATDTYEWDDRSIAFHRCRGCGCVTHWFPKDGRDRLGVNARLLPPDLLDGLRVRRLDGAVTEAYLDP